MGKCFVIQYVTCRYMCLVYHIECSRAMMLLSDVQVHVYVVCSGFTAVVYMYKLYVASPGRGTVCLGIKPSQLPSRSVT